MGMRVDGKKSLPRNVSPNRLTLSNPMYRISCGISSFFLLVLLHLGSIKAHQYMIATTAHANRRRIPSLLVCGSQIQLFHRMQSPIRARPRLQPATI